MTTFFFTPFLSLAITFGLGGVPLGVPPLEEDPLLARVAPEDCLWHWMSAGMAQPDPESGNHTEQLLAEPEIRALARVLEERLLELARRESGVADAQMTDDVSLLIKTLLTRPAAMFVQEVTAGPQGPGGKGALVVNLGDDREKIEKSLLRLEAKLLRGAAPEEVEDEGVAWRDLPLPKQAPPVQWAIKGRYLIVGAGHKAGGDVIRRASTDAPAWFNSVREVAGSDRVSTLAYLNVRGIYEISVPLIPTVEVRKALQASGLKSVDYLASVSALDEQAVVTRTLLATDARGPGLLKLADGKPISRDDLDGIPADSAIATLARFDAEQAFEAVLDLLEDMDPQLKGQTEQQLGELEEELRISIRRDLLAALADLWTLHGSPADGSFWTGAVATVSVRDRDALLRAHDTLERVLRDLFGGGGGFHHGHHRRREVRVQDFEHLGQTVHFLNFIGEESPVAPAWCLTGERLIVGLYPQAVKGYLRYLQSPQRESLADHPAVQEAFAGGAPPVAISFVDTRQVFREIYPWLQIGLQFGATQWQREGLDLDISHFPAARTIEQHLVPSVTSCGWTSDGFVVTSKQTLPANVLSAAPLAAGFMLPAVGSARGAARRAEDMNTLRQLGLALHNYEIVHKHLPAARWGKGDSPGLSWRVAILPYLEQQALYEQFHLDEPWDGEHNLKLIEKMPEFFRSASGEGEALAVELPEDATDKQGEIEAKYAAYKTRFVAIRAENSIFPSGGDATRPTSFRDITDGTSNTILLGRVVPSRAVIWTKPDDLDFDPDHPKAGLFDRRGEFLALFGDASVHVIRETVDADMLRALITRNGGEVISLHELGDLGAPRPRPVAASASGSASSGGKTTVRPRKEIEKIPER